MEGLIVRPLGPGDLPVILAIQAGSPEAAGWSAGDYARAARGEFPAWVAEVSGSVLGFLVARQMVDEIEILNLAVAPAARRAGVASSLLQEALSTGRSLGARRAFLEVRESNRVAQLLYERHGFSICGRRPKYYADPVEDALVLARALG